MRSLRDLLDDGLGNHRAGRLPAAEACYREALAIAPDDAEANHLSGILAFQSGRIGEAADRFRRAVAASGATAKYHANLGAALLALGRYEAALAPLERAVALDPATPNALVNLATACREAGRTDDAVAAGRRAVALMPEDAAAWLALAAALLRTEKAAEATDAARSAVAAAPEDAEARNLLGLALKAQGDDDAARAAFERAVALAPGYVEAHCNLGLLHQGAYRYAESEAHYRAAIAAAPEAPSGHAGLARTLKQQGRVEEAMPLYRQAAALAPDDARHQANLLFNLIGSADTDGPGLLDAHRAWAQRFAPPPAAMVYANRPDPARRLRIGYVSPDLRNHPVGRLLLPVLAAHDRAAVEAVCYAAAGRPDDTTAALRRVADGWHDVAALDDRTLAERVRADGIDILVDLAGHSARNRLRAFALRPAPVQATWLGYPSTTGMEAIGWLICDPVHAPPGAEAEFVERPMRLPHDLLCFQPPDDAPAVGPLPCRAAGHVVFASFNNPGKLSPATLTLWARVLAAVPGARLLIRYHLLSDPAACDRLRRRFAAAGVDPARLDFAGSAPYRDVLDSYNRADIALDTLPYSGTMTTLEALWMGVPVIALAGDRMAARQSAAHLSAAGLGELVARDGDGYVALAAGLAADPSRLAALRAGMRARLRASPLCDVSGFTRALEGAYRAMWEDWCAAGSGGVSR